ncbi:MAG TPA: helix-turn-helix domain-containing protein [Polyangiaceae bacterium]|nr:helix-turn-helix domain-containing protein [Polyangiaceae bacterium]
MSGQPKKRGLSIEQRAELWQRWKDGQSLSEIGRALCKPPGSVHTYLSVLGGIAPATGRRNALALTGREREEISRQLCAGSSMRLIAKLLMRPPSTIFREISRNGGREAYRADAADSRAWVQRSDQSFAS